MEAQLKQRARERSLLGLGWMDELSGSQFCDEKPRLRACSNGTDIGSRRLPGKRVSHASSALTLV